MKKEATQIVRKLQDAGYVSYFAGGSVRDILMRKESNDIDIATSAKPAEVENLFRDTHPIGKEFGTILVESGNHQFEVTTFRVEGDYKDGRHPSSLSYSSARQDASRRDFTINGIFYNPTKNTFIDFVGGRDDIKKGVISFIGKPEDRINEDKLRLVRAIRFKITLGFQYSRSTFEAIRKKADGIKQVSAERIRDELNKIISNENRHLGLIELSESKLLRYIIPELEKLKGVPQPEEYHHEGDCFTHIYLALKSLPRNASLRLSWAVLLHDIAKPQTIGKTNGRITFNDHATKSAELARNILKRLKFSNVEIEDISWLVHYHMSIVQIDQMRPNKRMAFLTDPRFNDLIDLVEADSRGTFPINLEMVDGMQIAREKAVKQQSAILKIAQTPRIINGDDLINVGIKPKEKYSEILETIHDMQITGELKNKDEAMEYIKRNFV